MNTKNQNTQSKPDGQALSDPAGSRFHYDSESGYIYDQREHAWITDLVEAWELLATYAEREAKCAIGDCTLTQLVFRVQELAEGGEV
jgi:hypothetical protein